MTSVCPLEKSFSVGKETTAPDAIMRLIDACAAEEACNDAYPNLQHLFFEIIDELNEHPVPIIVTDRESGEEYDALLTGDTLRSNVVIALYTTPIISVVPQAIYDTYQGDYELMTQLTGERLWVVDALSRGRQFSVLCTEDLVGRTPEEQLDADIEPLDEIAFIQFHDIDVTDIVTGAEHFKRRAQLARNTHFIGKSVPRTAG